MPRQAPKEDIAMGFPALDNMPSIHPGELLRDDLAELGISNDAFAAHIGEPANAVAEIVNGQRGISGLMALKLSRAFGTTSQYWLNLQNTYDVKAALAKHGGAIERIQPLPLLAGP